jgi:MULE transposase domain
MEAERARACIPAGAAVVAHALKVHFAACWSCAFSGPHEKLSNCNLLALSPMAGVWQARPTCFCIGLQWDEEQLKPEAERTLLQADLSDPAKPLVIIATQNMIGWANEHGHNRPVSMDCTFGLTKYGFSVCTLTALNGEHRGVPICIAIMGSESAEAFEEVIRKFKEKLRPDWQPSIVLADAAEAEHKAVRCVSKSAMRLPRVADISVRIAGHALFFKCASLSCQAQRSNSNTTPSVPANGGCTLPHELAPATHTKQQLVPAQEMGAT